MNELRTIPSEGSLRMPLGKIPLLVLGFGYYRNRHGGEPFFRLRDIADAIPESLVNRHIVSTKENYSHALTNYTNLGLTERLERLPGERGRPLTRAYVRVTDAGEDVLLQSVTHSVTHRGLSIPELFPIPEVAHTVMTESDVLNRVFRQVTGLGDLAIAASSMHVLDL